MTVGCGSDRALDPAGERLAARRAALGLPRQELPFVEAMGALDAEGWERRLEALALGDGGADEALDVGLAVEDLLLASGPFAEQDPGFAELLDGARSLALELARSSVDAEPGARRSSATALVATCARCHNRYRR